MFKCKINVHISRVSSSSMKGALCLVPLCQHISGRLCHPRVCVQAHLQLGKLLQASKFGTIAMAAVCVHTHIRVSLTE